MTEILDFFAQYWFFLTFLVGVILWYGRINQKVQQLEKRMEKVEEDVEKLEPTLKNIEITLAEIKMELTYLRKK